MERIKNNGLTFISAEVREKPHAQIEPKVETETEKQKVSQAKKKGGRKSTTHDVKGKVDFVKREKAIHEPVIADITFSSTDKKLIRELVVRQLLLAYDMTEDYAAKILCFVYDEATTIEGRRVYLLGGQVIADRLGLSYPTVQKIVQRLHKKNIVIKEPLIKNAYHFAEITSTFFKSISDNKQVLLTFKEIEEEQLEAVNEDGSLNEEMVN